MNISALVDQQFSFALKLVELSTDEKKGITDNRFTYYAFVKSILLQWDLAVRYWFEELATSASASAELKQSFERGRPIHELSLNQLLSCAERYISVADVSRNLSLELLMDRRDDQNSWLCVLEHALRSFRLSEREWYEKHHDMVSVYEKTSDHEGHIIDEPAQGVVLIASTATGPVATENTKFESKHWHNLELEYLHQLIRDSRQFINDERTLNAEN